jgi:ABC-type transport system involved in multi-copper enzyme maturation permease subunit
VIPWLVAVPDPVMRKELTGVSRRWTTYAFRTLYVIVLAFILWAIWFDYSDAELFSFSRFAAIGRELFTGFVVGQFALVCILSVLLGSDMISKEVRARTLGLLFLTPLQARHIAWGKWKSCMGVLVMIVLSGLPVLAVSVYMGGVTIETILQATALTLATAGFCTAAAIFFSASFRNGYVALVTTLIALVGYGLLPLLSVLLFDYGYRSEAEIFLFFSYSNPVFALMAVAIEPFGLGGPNPDRIWWVCSVVMLALALGLNVWTALRLRKLARAEPRPPLLSRLFAALDRFFERVNPYGLMVLAERRGVWEERPALWKEFRARASGKLRYFTRIVVVLLLLLVLLMELLGASITEPEAIISILGITMALMIFVAIGMGAGSFAKEKEGKTWDVLLSTPLSPGALVGSKMAGAAVGILPLAAMFALMFVVIGMAYPRAMGAVVLMAVATAAFLFFMIVVCMYFSLRLSGATKAAGVGIGVAIGILIGLPIFLAMLDAFTRGMSGRDFQSIMYMTNVFAYLDPLSRMRWGFGYYSRELDYGLEFFVFCVLYLGAASVLLYRMVAGFEVLTRRFASR